MKLDHLKPVWNLYEHGVTQSFINKWLTCKYQAKLEYYYGLTPKSLSLPMNFGSCIHYVLSELYAKESLELKQVPKFIRKYQLANEEKFEELASAQMQELEQLYGLAENMLYNYFAYYTSEFDNQWVINESVFRVKYGDFWLNGRYDGGYVTPNRRLYLLDTKCLSQIDEGILTATLPFDTQCMLYLFAAYLEGYKPSGITYNIIRRPQNRFLKNDTLQTFLSRIAGTVATNPSYYFIRHTLQVTKKEIDEWVETFLNPVLRDIKQWYDEKCECYLNPAALVTKYGKCPMFDVITSGNMNYVYQRKVPFSELQ